MSSASLPTYKGRGNPREDLRRPIRGGFRCGHDPVVSLRRVLRGCAPPPANFHCPSGTAKTLDGLVTSRYWYSEFMPLQSPQKVKQQRRVLLLALYLLKRRGYDRPKKKQVLNFISMRHLMHVPADDSDYRQTGDEIWENDLAFRRADLKSEGFIEMPDHGIWAITPFRSSSVMSMMC